MSYLVNYLDPLVILEWETNEIVYTELIHLLNFSFSPFDLGCKLEMSDNYMIMMERRLVLFNLEIILKRNTKKIQCQEKYFKIYFFSVLI